MNAGRRRRMHAATTATITRRMASGQVNESGERLSGTIQVVVAAAGCLR